METATLIVMILGTAAATWQAIEAHRANKRNSRDGPEED